MAERTRLLFGMAQIYLQLATDHSICIIFTNQVASKGGSVLAPALGESWAHCCTNRVMLRESDQKSHFEQEVSSIIKL